MEIPYNVEPRPDTGLYNAKLGIWLFLASEVMLFGALISSSVTMVMSWASLKLNDFKKFRLYMGLTFLAGVGFLIIKAIEYNTKFHHGYLPKSNTFLAIYFTLTGLHGLHVIGGMVVNGYFWGPGSKMWRTEPERFTNRIEVAGLYWHFVDLVWIFLFPTLYLL